MPKPDLSRRGFLHSTALGLGALGLSAGTAQAQTGAGGTPPGPDLPVEPTGRPQPAMNGPNPWPAPPGERVGWAVCGLGHFAQNYVLPHVKEGVDSRLTGLISGTPDKLAQVGDAYAVPEAARFGYDMAGLAEADDIDVVYVVTPNAIHETNVVRAAEAGKHVFCEKPMATSPAAGQRMIDACAANGVNLGVAYRAHFEPHNVELKRMIEAGALGRIEFVASDHHRPLDPKATRDIWRMRKDLAGGGSLPDIGIYSLNGLIWFMDEVPNRLVAQTHAPAYDDDRFAEVEGICNVLLEFPSGRRGQISSGYIASKKRIDVWGSDGVAVLDPATSYMGNSLSVSRVDGTEEVAVDDPDARQFWEEIDHFSRHVRDGAELRITAEMGLRDLRLIEAIYASAERGVWVEIGPDGAMKG
ncbi:Gfo/Idh/MocA family oxidoreductase [uncultured Jannaschia sp.]|uniref:Gfo/Idh/MocA family protein n=1 Tax=uncultured Jannaschia sp. TaxID=293347 RepID=UPI00262EC961|nr:Gfo/Idh/MocA family oxidoreductase [uncultured Jannaschia sp.]